MKDRGTLVVDNFTGSMTSRLYGDINSGRSWAIPTGGQNPFIKPGQLTWSEAPVQIDPDGLVITDLVVAQKERVESGILYVYAIGHTGRLYKIQVNNPATYDPDYDNPTLVTTLTINSPTFTRGGFMDFFGATEQIYIGHDMGVTRINFDGTSEAFVGVMGSYTQTVPRPLKQFVGKLYIGNGSNLAEVDSTGTVTSYTKLSPGFPTNSQVRDLDITPDGNYLDAVVSTLPLFDITSSAQETTSSASAGSYIFKWNGTDIGYTAFTSFPSYALGANVAFQNYQYTFGADQFGTAVYAPTEKIIFIPEAPTPLPNAINSTGNMVMWLSPLYFEGNLEADLFVWGSLDFEVGHPLGWWDVMFFNATAPETDVIRIPCMTSVSNTGFGASSNGYTNGVFGTSKIYFSSLETSSGPTTKYRYYTWSTTASQDSPVVGTVQPGAIYQTQSQMFSKKVSVSEVRIYAEPWISGNSFQFDLIGSNSQPITNGSKTFTAGASEGDGVLVIGNDYAWWGPDMIPSYCLGFKITNLGDANFTINKVEIDWGPAGK